ncbi:MAG: CHAT domain-containing protein [Chloroflexi bacterium]|nr:MAG: CHAT domain-containing protein [Chloroflexota bacterium]
MPELILRFNRVAADVDDDFPIPFQVTFEGQTSDFAVFKNPLDDKDLAEIRWYLEQYTYWPSDIDDERARKVEGQLPKWGRQLFDAVFGKEAGRLFERFDDRRGENNLLVIETAEPRILRLPWELLSDKSGYLFSKRPQVTVTRRMQTLAANKSAGFEPPVRILMVSSRPEGAGFIDPRSIATPLLEALEGVPEQGEVEFLRPPTLKALDERLRDENLPRVHIVHFDGHGVYDQGVGLGFLLFEVETFQMHRVDAEQLGALLNESGITLMVLNACQSAQPDDRKSFASVASRLIESGVGGVVAMNYSVLVETAKRFTAEFYGALARGKSASAAMDAARRDLFRDTRRITFQRPGEEETVIVHLQDWFLPALYQQADELVPFKPSPALRAPSPSGRGQGEGKCVGFPPPPLHGFKGRARELLDLEGPSRGAVSSRCTVLADRARLRWQPRRRSGSRARTCSSGRPSCPSRPAPAWSSCWIRWATPWWRTISRFTRAIKLPPSPNLCAKNRPWWSSTTSKAPCPAATPQWRIYKPCSPPPPNGFRH